MQEYNSQERICAIIELLAKSFPTAKKTKDIAGILKTSNANISRDISVLEKFGFISKNENGIRLSRKFGKISDEMRKGYDNAISKIEHEREEYFN